MPVPAVLTEGSSSSARGSRRQAMALMLVTVAALLAVKNLALDNPMVPGDDVRLSLRGANLSGFR